MSRQLQIFVNIMPFDKVFTKKYNQKKFDTVFCFLSSFFIFAEKNLLTSDPVIAMVISRSQKCGVGVPNSKKYVGAENNF